MDFPPMETRAFPGKREEAYRAGITPRMLSGTLDSSKFAAGAARGARAPGAARGARAPGAWRQLHAVRVEVEWLSAHALNFAIHSSAVSDSRRAANSFRSASTPILKAFLRQRSVRPESPESRFAP